MRIYGKGTAAIGKVLCDIRIGQRVKILKDGEVLQESTDNNPLRVISILKNFDKISDEANKDENIVMLLRGVQGELSEGVSIIMDAIQNNQHTRNDPV